MHTRTLELAPEMPAELSLTVIKPTIESRIHRVIDALPAPQHLSSTQQRELIGRYTAVLEGNFIYWMTAAYLAVRSEDARPIIIDNLLEEVRDSHPTMLRKFALAAHAFPTEADALAVHEGLTNVRQFLGRLSGVQTLATMAFFEGFIQAFMPYLADLAIARGSSELEYTDVHGVCDIAHTEGLFNALSAEMTINPLPENADLYEGVDLLEALLDRIIHGEIVSAAA
jgi:Iron-containing redox enzyme